ncbi:undecaprenyl-phosphate galactose phosphotransferase [Plasticicumulans acidivorans]|uniref:Undecaprenyl-phosphate galactose phosphotransferase n=1 Tax=Plasticicumulans acidivorans TaxID=886464 RepID=A0A317MZF6_9GAMM|nr:sugar transferase [Plasticicumulans acidivorans]PWV65625.1 undecaprenyl-phosphate galactose phosphotransferase [Plasticicumulans acidivorans]
MMAEDVDSSKLIKPVLRNYPCKRVWLDTNLFIVQSTIIIFDAICLLLCFMVGQWSAWLNDHISDLSFDIWLARNGLVDASLYALVAAAIGINRFWVRGHYSKRQPFWDEVRQIVEIVFKLALVNFTLLMLVKADTSRLGMLLTWTLAVFGLPFARRFARAVLRAFNRWERPAVIVGGGFNALESGAALTDERWMGLKVVGFFVPDGEPVPCDGTRTLKGRRVPVRPLHGDPAEMFVEWEKPVIVVALEMGGLNAHTHLLHSLQRMTSELYVIPALRGLPLCGMDVGHFFSHEVLLLQVKNNLGRYGHQLAKRLFDISVSALLLLLLSPLLAWLAWAVRRDGGAAVFAHERIGQCGNTFRCLKFRTMVPDAQLRLQELLKNDPAALAEWEKDRKLKNDPRVTRIGALLRKRASTNCRSYGTY